MATRDLHKYALGMVYKYRWLDQALEDLEQEVGYVFYEFGIASARKAEATIHECVTQLCSFPHLGVTYEGLKYNGNEVRILHAKQVSIIYNLEGELITLIALWNNRRDNEVLKSVIMSRQ